MGRGKIKLDFYMIVALLGFFSTTPIITLSYGSRDIALFRVLFYLIIVILGIRTITQQKVRIGRNSIWLDYWLIEAVIACGLGGLILSSSAPQFARSATSYIVKTAAFLVFAVMWVNQPAEKLNKANNVLFKGLLFGCIANLIWASIDGIGYYTLGFSVNNRLFAGYIARHHVRYNMLSLITRSGLFRAAGFNSDPAQIGFIAPLITCYACYKKKWWLLVLVLLGTLSSASTTALVTTAVVFLLWLIGTRPAIRRTTSRNFIIVVAALLGAVIIWSLFGDQLGVFVSRAVSRIIHRLDRLYVQSDVTTNIRWQYVLFLPRALFNLNINSLFGLGFGTASYGYVTDDVILNVIGHQNYFAYDPENTYISYLLDTGVIGFALFVYFMVKLIRYFSGKLRGEYTETEIIGFAGILSTILSMFFYHYILFTPQMLIAIVGLSMMDADPDRKLKSRINMLR